MTLANQLTLLRLALVPVFMSFMIVDTIWTRILALIIFIGASITDWYDGKLARQTGTVTLIGTFMDPLVDKALIAAALVGFVELRELHIAAWMVVLIIIREFLITGLRSLAASRGIVMAAEAAGKWKTAFQMTAIITILVILIANEALNRWGAGLPRSADEAMAVVHWFLWHVPYWLLLATTVVTVVSGYFYIYRYRELLNRELSLRHKDNLSA